MLLPMNIHHFLFAFDGEHICWFLSRSSSVLPPSAPEWTVSCPRKERCREVLFDIRQIRHLHISSVKCKASKLVSQRQWAARPFSETERRLGPSSSLCDHGSMLYVFEIIWIIWFAWLNPDLLNLWSSDAPVCLYVCNCLLMCVLFSLTSSCLSSSGAPIRKLPWQLAARQLSCCDGCTGCGKRPEGQNWWEGWGWRWLSSSHRSVSVHDNASLEVTNALVHSITRYFLFNLGILTFLRRGYLSNCLHPC